jgi:hypothetical protein
MTYEGSADGPPKLADDFSIQENGLLIYTDDPPELANASPRSADPSPRWADDLSI